jgi:hypothetical protein
MNILKVEIDEYANLVTAESDGETVEFNVQMADGVHIDHGDFWITSDRDGDEGGIDREEYENFDLEKIITAAEEKYAEHHAELYEDEDLDISSNTMNGVAIVMRTYKDGSGVGLYPRDSSKENGLEVITDTRLDETIKDFDSRESALKYLETFSERDEPGIPHNSGDVDGLREIVRELSSEKHYG